MAHHPQHYTHGSERGPFGYAQAPPEDGRAVVQDLFLRRHDQSQTPSPDVATLRRKVVPSPLKTVQVSSPVHTSSAGASSFISAGPSSFNFPAPPQPYATTVGYPRNIATTTTTTAKTSTATLTASVPAEPSTGTSSLVDSSLRSQQLHAASMAPISDMAPIPEHDLLGASRSTMPNQVRTASAPTLPAASAPPPAAPLPNSRLSSIPHMDEWPSVRKSSIDSALSSLLSQPSQSRKSSEDSVTSNLADIANLSSAAGSPEAAIQYLLKEKQSSAAQNAQLWRLVDKQRTMILGLNRDLERALSDKERYRKRLKEHLAHCSHDHYQHHAIRPDQEANAVPAAEAMAAPLPPTSLTPQPPSVDSSEQSAASGDDLRGDRTTLSMTDDPEHAVRHGKNANMIRAPHGPTPPASRENSVSARQDAPRSSKPGVAISRAGVPPSHNGRAVPLSPEESETASEKRGLSPDGASPISQTTDDLPSRQPHAGRPHVAPLEKPPEVPCFSLSEPSPPMIEPRRGSGSNARKAPPAPLKLTQSKPVAVRLQPLAPDEYSGSEYDDFIEKDEVPQMERGRRRTREEDDRMRELALAKEQERRSLSKKERGSKSAPMKPAAATTTTTLQVSDAAPPHLLDAAPVL